MVDVKKTTYISLTSEQRDRLMSSVAEDSEVWKALRDAADILHRAPNVSRRYDVVCEETVASMLLYAAKKNCPEAVPEIELAIQRFQPPSR
jgi:hypothetical protein